jgi:hypothetical protein
MPNVSGKGDLAAQWGLALFTDLFVPIIHLYNSLGTLSAFSTVVNVCWNWYSPSRCNCILVNQGKSNGLHKVVQFLMKLF